MTMHEDGHMFIVALLKKKKKSLFREVARMVEQEDPQLISSHRHGKITTIHRATIDQNDLNTSRNDLH